MYRLVQSAPVGSSRPAPELAASWRESISGRAPSRLSAGSISSWNSMLTWKCSTIPTTPLSRNSTITAWKRRMVPIDGRSATRMAATTADARQPQRNQLIEILGVRHQPQLDRDAGNAENQDRQQDAAGGVAHRPVIGDGGRRQRATHHRRAVGVDRQRRRSRRSTDRADRSSPQSRAATNRWW